MPNSRSLKESIGMTISAFKTGRKRERALRKAKTVKEKSKIQLKKFKP